jgi:hypothetical protein
VFFDPDTYPMNWAWWDGQVPLEHYRAEHPLDDAATISTGEEPADCDKGAVESSQSANDNTAEAKR